MKTFGMALLLLFAASAVNAQVALVKKGKPVSRILVQKNNPVDSSAASILQLFSKRISHATLPIVVGQKPKKGDVVIGDGDTAGLTQDGFRLATDKGMLYVSSGGGNGTIYGVETLLENYFGVTYFGPDAWHVAASENMTVPALNHFENPDFRYRQSQCYGFEQDPLYKNWLRFESPEDVFAGGYWVHTSNRILPADVYGKAHPEYYSFTNGKRRPGAASQWCMTNPDVFEIVAHKVDSIFKAHPGMKMISISQNDGNGTNCKCPKCKAIDDYEGSPIGSVLYLVNKLAKRFPDKEFSTLAYLYTMQPPKHMKPLPNVNIMLCDIDCMREVPLTDNVSGQTFVKALKGWSAITNNIFVWDYGINFDNMVEPFPNFPVLQKNIQLFKKYHATMHFSQIGGSYGGDFPEMRAYIVSKLMWNTKCNADSLMQTFMKGYYGPAAPYLYQYEKLLEGALLASNHRLWIYDSPVSHKEGMFNDKCLKRYNELYDQAEAAVANDPVLLKRVRIQRLGLQYSWLEIARTKSNANPDEVKAQLDLFESRCREYGIKTLNERNNSPLDYCKLYRERYMPNCQYNIAKDAKVIWITPPAPAYQKLGETAFTDNLFGGSTFGESWVGWQGKDGAFILDMGKDVPVKSISADFLHQLGAWVLLPKKVTYSVSSDNKNYQLFGECIQPEDRSMQIKYIGEKSEKDQPVMARYIKVEVTATKHCPSWHYGVGSPAWFFIDEVIVH